MDAPLARDPRYHSLDVCRGLICLWVVLEHASVALWPGSLEATGWEGWLRWGLTGPFRLYLGAPLFLVISGYCIAASVDSARRRGTTALQFLRRRFLRIFPTYWMALLLCLVVVAGLDFAGLGRLHRGGYAIELASPRDLGLAQWIGNLTLTEIWRPRFWGTSEAVYTRVAWSLCYQEQFYVVCFVLLLATPRRLYRAMAGLTGAVVLFRILAWDSGMLFRLHGLFPELWHEFAIGLAVYYHLNACTTAWVRRGIELGIAGLLVLALATGLTSTVATALFGLILIVLRRWDGRLESLRWLDPVRACGKRSFSMYLVHLPVCVVTSAVLTELGLTAFWSRALVVMPLATLAAVGVTWVFFHHVERRFIEAAGAHRPPARSRLFFLAAPLPSASSAAA